MRGARVAGALALVVLGAGLVGCATNPQLSVLSVQFTPTGGREPTVVTTSQEPFILPSGVAGTIDVFFTVNVGIDRCTLTLDGVHSISPIPIGQYDVIDHVVRLRSTGLSDDRLTKGTLECSDGSQGFGSRPAIDTFSVATQLVIVPFIDPGQVDFPTTQAGSRSSNEAILLGNVGSLSATVAAVRISGAGAGDFRFADEPCTGTTLGTNQSCEVKVEFAPQSAGTKSAIVEFELTSADPKHPDTVSELVLLRGTATAAPTPTPEPPPQDQPHHPPVG